MFLHSKNPLKRETRRGALQEYEEVQVIGEFQVETTLGPRCIAIDRVEGRSSRQASFSSFFSLLWGRCLGSLLLISRVPRQQIYPGKGSYSGSSGFNLLKHISRLVNH